MYAGDPFVCKVLLLKGCSPLKYTNLPNLFPFHWLIIEQFF